MLQIWWPIHSPSHFRLRLWLWFVGDIHVSCQSRVRRPFRYLSSSSGRRSSGVKNACHEILAWNNSRLKELHAVVAACPSRRSPHPRLSYLAYFPFCKLPWRSKSEQWDSFWIESVLFLATSCDFGEKHRFNRLRWLSTVGRITRRLYLSGSQIIPFTNVVTISWAQPRRWLRHQ